MNDQEINEIIKKADTYLKYHGQKKHLNWFDMSHLLSYIISLSKEEIFEIHMQQYSEE